MTAISWKSPVNGDWNVAADWSTDTVPTSADDVTISVTGPYIVTVGSARTISIGILHFLSFPAANSLTFNAFETALLENIGKLTLTGALTVDSGFVSLNEANTIGSVMLTGGTLAIGNGGALGAGAVSLSGGELLTTANETLTNALSFSGSSTIAAAHGTTLTENASSLSVAASSTLNFGALGEDGTILLHVPTSTTFASPLPTIDVQAGTLKGADSSFGFFLDDEAITVATGATLDLAGNTVSITNLSGGGAVIDSGAAGTLSLDTANFSGAVSGPLSFVANGPVVLSGANTYAGTTGIHSGDSLQIGAGGATGSIGGGAVSDAGALIIDRNNGVALTNAISGAGVLKQIGTGATSINAANTYTGGTTLSAGTLAIGKGGALGTGTLTFTGGELLGTATETLANALNLSTSGSTTTVAAATGTTLDVTGAITYAGNNTVDIGAPGQDGEVLWGASPLGSNVGDTFDVLDGTLTAANSGLGTTLNAITGTTVASGATLDWGGNLADIDNLQGAGTVTNSGAAETMSLVGTTNFSGAISGALSVTFEGNASLSGLEDYTGAATLEGSDTVANTGTYDIVGNTNISGTPASLFINDGLLEKTGGGGVSDVTTNFINSGTLNVLSGSIEFSGGFTNNGVIHGLVTQSGGVTTVSAAVPTDFNGDTLPDILWQNKQSGQASVWEMNENDRTGGGPVSSNPGPSWTAVGSGDFNGDGHADILWQNSDGQASVWEMNGNTRIGGGPVSSNPGPSWKAIGTGDFNGDGLSDILWQNTDGQVSIWEMNENTRVGGGPLTLNPGPAWKAVGTGDFNGDGLSDILFQNASTGQVSIWEMNGSTRIGGGAVADSPGTAWKVVGSGDFNHDGDADILFQNTTTGQLSIWEMNGNTRVGGGPVGANLGPSWHAVGIGGGGSDILLQSASGQATIWEMNGNAIAGGGLVAANPGPSWRAVA